MRKQNSYSRLFRFSSALDIVHPAFFEEQQGLYFPKNMKIKLKNIRDFGFRSINLGTLLLGFERNSTRAKCKDCY